MKSSRPFKKLWPLLALYIIIVLVFSTDTLFGDELRHVDYATNLSNGYFAETDNPQLRNGPGYPLVLAPFVAFNIGLLVPKLLNAFFLFFAVVYFKKTLDLFTTKKFAIVFVYIIALYPPVIRWIPFLYSESLAFLIGCGIIYHYCSLIQYDRPNLKQFTLVSFLVAALVLVKIIFLQVIGVGLLLLGLLFLFRRSRPVKKTSVVLLLAFLWILPYLAYAFLLTGKPFMLGTAGGEILYHRSTPYENEWGNWFSREDILMGSDNGYKPSKVYKNLNVLAENHRDVYLKLEPLTYIERDSAFKSIAIENMKAHPSKYFKNTVSNVSRLLFNFPFSYRSQTVTSYGYMIPNMFLLVLLVFCLYPFIKSNKTLPFELKAVMVFHLIYIVGIVLLDGRGRNFITVVPSLVLFMAYVVANLMNFNLVKSDN